jgi:hypothetical protein
MGTTDEILAEYILMRKNGRDTNEVLDTLRPYIKPLSKTTKQELARSIRDWEKRQDVPEQASDRPSGIKPLKSVAKTEIRKIEKADWFTCPHCSKKNRTKEDFCYACGLMLEVSAHIATKHFTDRLTPDNEYFGTESVLVLKVHNTDHEYEVRPQASNQGIFIGRSAANSTMTPDIDLSKIGAERQGVSRLHMEIKYDPKTEVLQISDLGSVNGSFINGRKLHPKEIKMLHNGDEIKLGHLIMRADFYHPGDEI